MSQRNVEVVRRVFELSQQGFRFASVAYVFTVDNGRLVRMRIFATKAQALEAAGLRG